MASPRIFISYSKADKDIAHALANCLEDEGVTVYIDYMMPAGCYWEETLVRWIRSSDTFVVLLSSSSVRKGVVRREIEIAQETASNKKGHYRILPIRVEFEDELPLGFGTELDKLQYLTWDRSQRIADLAQILLQAIEPQTEEESNDLHSEPISHGLPKTSQNVPTAPEPYFRHEYWKLVTFCGRRLMREHLSRWLSEESKTVFVLSGGPGMGKSALAWTWLHGDVIKGPAHRDLKGILRWSFDDEARSEEEEPPFRAFLRHSLAYVSKGRYNLEEDLSSGQRLEYLRSFICEGKFLFVLDGFERELNSFVDNSVPSSIETTRSHSKSWRNCSDGLARRFLEMISSTPMRSRFLICTRIVPLATEWDDGSMLPYCRAEAIPELSVDEAYELAQARGIDKEVGLQREDLDVICRRLGGSPLGLLEAFKHIRHECGDKKGKVRPSSIQSSSLSGQDIEGTFFRSFNALPASLSEALITIAAFERPVDSWTLQRVIKEHQRDELGRHLLDIVSTGLVAMSFGTYEMHPLVRHYVRQWTSGDRRKEIHGDIARYLRGRLNIELKNRATAEVGRTGVSPSKVPEWDRLMDLAELFHHMVQAGHRVDAFSLFLDYLWSPLVYKFSDYGKQREMLTGPLRNLSTIDSIPLKTSEAEVFALNQLANIYRMGGGVVDAVWIHRAIVDWDRRRGKPGPQAIRQELLGLDQILVGHYLEAESNLLEALQATRRLERIRELKNGNRAACYRDLGRLYVRTGQFEKSKSALEKADRVARRGEARKYLTPILSLRSQEVLRSGGSSKDALAFAEAAIKAEKGHETARHRAEALLARGQARAAMGDIEVAEADLNYALRLSRELSLFEIEVTATIAIGRFYLTAGEERKALESASAACRLAWLGEYIGLKAEGYLLLAEICMKSRQITGARQHAEKARDLSSRRIDLDTRELRDNDLVPGHFDAVVRGRAEEIVCIAEAMDRAVASSLYSNRS